MDRDRNLLFGIFAVQLHKVDPIHLMEVAGAWAVDPSRDLGRRLVEEQALSEHDRAILSALVDEAVKAHSGDANAALETFGGEDQVQHSFRGTIILTESGGVSRLEEQPTKRYDPAEDAIPGVEEAPGRYTHVSDYARGGMGRVLLVHDEHLARDVALKELLPGLGSTTREGAASPVQRSMPIVARFLQEARLTGQLEHPSIVPVYELGRRKDGTLYYTMKLVRGRTLARALRDAESLRERLGLLSHFVDLCQAIAYAHSRGVIHRDLKPGNVMVGEFGETVVIDWGLAKAKGREDIHADEMTTTYHAMELGDEESAAKTAYGQALGTPAYMPPEQAAGKLDEVNERADVYSLGAVLYQILTGKRPFKGKTVGETIRAVIDGTPEPVRTLEPAAPPELAAICERAMARNAEDRYSSAKALAKEVQSYLSGALVEAYEYKVSEYVCRFATKHRAVLATAAAALFLLLGASAVYTHQVVQANRFLAKARDSEASQRIAAETARNQAEEAREQERLQKERALREFYYASIMLAQRSIEENRFDTAREYLDACPEEFRHWEWGRLKYLCELDCGTLAGHSRGVTAVAFGAGGNVLATSSMDGTVKVWDTGTRQEIVTLRGHTGGVSAVAFSRDGKRIATGGSGAAVMLWDAETGENQGVLQGHNGWITDLAFGSEGDLLVSCGADGLAILWSLGERTEQRRFPLDSGWVLAVDISRNGEWIALGGEDNAAHLRETATGAPVVPPIPHPDHVTGVGFAPDTRTLATACRDGTVRIYDTASGALVAQAAAHDGEVLDVAFGPDGNRLATSGDDHTVKLWNPSPLHETHAFRGHSAAVTSVAFSPDGRRIASGSEDGLAKLWDTGGQCECNRLSPQTDEFDLVALCPETATLAVVDHEGRVTRWDIETREQTSQTILEQGSVAHIAATDCGRYIAVAGQDGPIGIHAADNGRLIRTITCQDGGVACMTFSPNGQWLAVGCEDGCVRMFSVAYEAAATTLEGHPDGVCTVGFDDRSKRLVAGCWDGSAVVWDLDSRAKVRTFSPSDGVGTSAVLDDDGQRLAMTRLDGRAHIIELETGEVLAEFNPGIEAITLLTLSSDGRRLATAMSDRSVGIWDVATGRQIMTTCPLADDIIAIAFEANRLYTVTLGERYTVVSWPRSLGPHRE